MLLDFRSLPIFGRIINILVFLLLSIALSFDDSPKSAVLSIFLGWILIVMPLQFFAIAEKTKLETLHTSLPLTRGDIVKARYLWFICILVTMVLPLLLKLLFYPNDKMTYFLIACIFLSASIYVAIMFPLYFQFGIGKVSYVITIFIIYSFLIFIFGFRSRFLALFSRLIPETSAVIAVAVGLLFLYMSYLSSLSIYRTRDL